MNRSPQGIMIGRSQLADTDTSDLDICQGESAGFRVKGSETCNVASTGITFSTYESE